MGIIMTRNIQQWLQVLNSHIDGFQKQMLCWYLAYKHNFAPHSEYIWNSQDTCFRHFSKNGWKTASCLSVSCVWSFMSFLNNPREFSIVTEAVPHDSRFLVPSAPRTAPLDVLPQLSMYERIDSKESDQ